MNTYKKLGYFYGDISFELSYVSKSDNLRKTNIIIVDEWCYDNFIELLKNFGFEEGEDE